MNHTDFQIEDGVLTKYLGYDKDVVIPDGVTAIGDWAFYGGAFHSVKIPDSVRVIGENAFALCKYLQTVEIPDSVSVIASFAFYQCERLQSVKMGNNVRSIAACAFKDCRNLQSVEISENILVIRRDAFSGCSSLKRFRFGGKFKIIQTCFAERLEDHLAPYVIHLVLQNPDDFHPDDISYCREHIGNLKEFCRELTGSELPTMENYGFITKENAALMLEIFRENRNVECVSELIRYINENQLFGDYMEQFRLDLEE